MKRLGTLVFILFVAVGGYFLLRWYSAPTEFIVPTDFKISQWKQDNIDSLVLTFFPDKKMAFSKRDAQWFVGEFKADQVKVDNLFMTLSEAELTSRVSTNKQNHERFKVDQQGIILEMSKAGDVFQKIIIGKSAGGSSVYVRLDGQDSVYVLNGLGGYLFSEDLIFWRDKSILTYRPDEIRLVHFENKEANWKLEKKETGWTSQLYKFPLVELDEAQVIEWLNGLVKLQVIDFPSFDVENKKIVGGVTIELGTPDSFSKKLTWVVSTTEAEQDLLIKDEEKSYLVSKSSFEDIFKSYDDLLNEWQTKEESAN